MSLGIFISHDRSVMSVVIDEDRTIEKIGSRAVIPLPELPNLDFLAIEALEGFAKVPCEEMGLELQFGRIGSLFFSYPSSLERFEKLEVGAGHGRVSERMGACDKRKVFF